MLLLRVTNHMILYSDQTSPHGHALLVRMLTCRVATSSCEHCTTADLDACRHWLKRVETAKCLCYAPSLHMGAPVTMVHPVMSSFLVLRRQQDSPASGFTGDTFPTLLQRRITEFVHVLPLRSTVAQHEGLAGKVSLLMGDVEQDRAVAMTRLRWLVWCHWRCPSRL